MQPNETEQLAALFRRAVEHQMQGRPREALQAYDAVIRLSPRMAAAHCNRGIVLQALGNIEGAIESYDRAIQLEPRAADAHFNKGIALAVLHRSDDALRSYEQAITLNPHHLAAHGNRGHTLRALKRPSEALESFDRVIALNPRLAAAHSHRGSALQDLSRFEDAVQSFEQALRLQPDLAEAWYNRGTALLALKRPREAVESFDRAIRLEPKVAEAHNQRGHALRDLKRFDEALLSYERAALLEPGFAEAHCNIGNVHYDLKRLDKALESHNRATVLKPDYAPAYFNRGNTLREQGRVDEALASYDRAMALKPFDYRGEALADLLRRGEGIDTYDRAVALGKAMCLLQTGNFEEGWPLYEWRKAGRVEYRAYPQPAWSGGESLDGKTLLVFAEQGLGDTIQFCRYALLARTKGPRVILAAQDPLQRLLKHLGSGIDVVGLTSELPHFDYQIALLSMPLVFGTNLTTCPQTVPYLRAEPERVAQWRERLGSDGFKIGICWQGNRKSESDAGRSMSLRHFERLAKLPGVRLISLQKNDGAEELLDLAPPAKVEALGDEFDAPPDAFVDTAAVMESLDLIVTSDTAIAHLAGALGRPVWLALKHVPDWRWFLRRSDSPWYPSMRLFRQPARDDWSAVFAAMESLVLQRQR